MLENSGLFRDFVVLCERNLVRVIALCYSQFCACEVGVRRWFNVVVEESVVKIICCLKVSVRQLEKFVFLVLNLTMEAVFCGGMSQWFDHWGCVENSRRNGGVWSESGDLARGCNRLFFIRGRNLVRCVGLYYCQCWSSSCISDLAKSVVVERIFFEKSGFM